MPGKLSDQALLRLPNYGEAQSAESRADFIHKLKLCQKELRETKVWLQIVQKADIVNCNEVTQGLIDESNELISIFVASAKTARKNQA